ncbi:MAG: hypothetical protein Q4D13_07610 [Erysipelotrichaceae bacterium]|nr:hypothetical protein [Erysipelotrichaceae bacterium]
MRTLDEIMAELETAEKEYTQKCEKYGIEEKKRNKKENTDENDVKKA